MMALISHAFVETPTGERLRSTRFRCSLGLYAYWTPFTTYRARGGYLFVVLGGGATLWPWLQNQTVPCWAGSGTLTRRAAFYGIHTKDYSLVSRLTASAYRSWVPFTTSSSINHPCPSFPTGPLSNPFRKPAFTNQSRTYCLSKLG